MATIKVKFRPSASEGGEGSVYYQIIHERATRQISPGYHIRSEEWDRKNSTVNVSGRSDRINHILSIRERIRRDVERLTRIDLRLQKQGVAYTATDVLEQFNLYIDRYTVFNFMADIIAKLKQQGKLRTAETYSSTLNSFMKFREGDDLMLDAVSSRVMEDYEAWLHQRGVTPNTISFYLRILRATYNRAVEEEVIENRNPFRRVYTGVDKTVKRALPLGLIKKIKRLDLSTAPALDYARDMFMLSFMLRGMSFVDMAYLKKTDRVNGQVRYRRRKTGQLLTIAWTAEMQTILDKYPENSSPYLLPIIRVEVTNERSVYRNRSYNINYNLKTVGEMAGVTIPLTLYVARHSWASAAKAKGIPLSVISEGMGHDSETTTQIYLASLDTSVVDKANSLILGSL